MSTSIDATTVAMQDYRSHPAVNQSSLKVLGESPQLYYGRYVSQYIPESEPSASMLFGSAVEQYIRTGGTHNYVLLPPHIKQRRGAAYEDWKETLDPGAEVLIRSEWDERRIGDLDLIAANVRQHEKARVILDRGVWHDRLFWTDKETGIECKAEVDLTYVSQGVTLLADLKTTRDTSAEAFAKSCVQYGYDIQAAWYSWGYYEVYGVYPRFVFIAVRNSMPFDCECWTLDADFMTRGESRMRALLRELAQRRRDNEWQTPTWGKIATLSAPRWAL